MKLIECSTSAVKKKNKKKNQDKNTCNDCYVGKNRTLVKKEISMFDRNYCKLNLKAFT